MTEDVRTAARLPASRTLAKYGLTLAEWKRILKRQGGGCGVCGSVPASGILHIEHEHIRGWRKLPAQDRRKFVRGLACWFCNGNLLRRGCTPERLRSAANYLDRYLTTRAEQA